jgi:hypothetical protein
MERQPFCNFIQDLTKPKDEDVSQKCKIEISQRGIMRRGDSSESEDLRQSQEQEEQTADDNN